MKVYIDATVFEKPVTLKRQNGSLSHNVSAVAKGQPWKPKDDPKAQWTVFIPVYNEAGEQIGQLSAKSTEIKVSKRMAERTFEIVEAQEA